MAESDDTSSSESTRFSAPHAAPRFLGIPALVLFLSLLVGYFLLLPSCISIDMYGDSTGQTVEPSTSPVQWCSRDPAIFPRPFSPSYLSQGLPLVLPDTSILTFLAAADDDPPDSVGSPRLQLGRIVVLKEEPGAQSSYPNDRWRWAVERGLKGNFGPYILNFTKTNFFGRPSVVSSHQAITIDIIIVFVSLPLHG